MRAASPITVRPTRRTQPFRRGQNPAMAVEASAAAAAMRRGQPSYMPNPSVARGQIDARRPTQPLVRPGARAIPRRPEPLRFIPRSVLLRRLRA